MTMQTMKRSEDFLLVLQDLRHVTDLLARTAVMAIIAVASSVAAAASATDVLLDSLKATIARQDEFTERKEAAIGAVRSLLEGDSVPDAEVCRVNTLLFERYRKYQVDSAIACIDRAEAAALRLGDGRRALASGIRKSMALSMCSRFLEAEEILRGISPEALDSAGRLMYYEARSCLLEYYAAAAPRNRYDAAACRDSVFRYLSPHSYSRRVAVAASLAPTDSAGAEVLFRELLAEYGPDSPEYAMLTNHYATVSLQLGHHDRVLDYYLRSAIADIRSATRETLSLQAVAMMLYEDGRYREAYDFTLLTLSDIRKSGISFRSATTYDAYSIITSALREEEQRSHRRLLTLLAVSALSLLVLIGLTVCIYRQMRRIARMNALLNEKNVLLYENNVTKQSYIAEFFDVCHHYIDRMEQTQKSLYKLAAARSFAELTRRLQADESVAEETDGLYRRFDSIFLKLYPTFVEDFNRLLRDDERVRLPEGALLNRELRIYALMRLGITDSGRIAQFLRCSTSTVYNYRTRLRNRAVDREHFEEDIMKIKAAHDL